MGLDITAFKSVRLVKTLDDDDSEDYKWDTQTLVWHNPVNGSHFPEQLEGSDFPAGKNSVYEYEDSFGFRAGSYSGYNQWRAQLCQMALGVTPDRVWNNPDEFRGEPFYYLINFSDCEGVIGVVVSRRLLADFDKFDDRAQTIGVADEWFYEKYCAWRKAFQLASENGFVAFH